MGGETEVVDTETLQVDRDLAGPLDGVAVNERADRAREPHDLGDRLQHAGLVVGQHHRHQCRLGRGRERRVEGGQVQNTVTVDGQDLGVRHATTHAVMLDRRHQHPPAPSA